MIAAGLIDVVTCQAVARTLAELRGWPIGGEAAVEHALEPVESDQARRRPRRPSHRRAAPRPQSERTVIHLIPTPPGIARWYLPFQVFRMRLVTLIDLLLDRMAAQPGLSFTLDSQTATVDDYLQLRPDREPEMPGCSDEGG